MRFHVDVSVGDPIWPGPAVVEFSRLLGGNIRLLGYPIPMVLAEKIVTASQRGITSTRWRDFADLYLLAGQHQLERPDRYHRFPDHESEPGGFMAGCGDGEAQESGSAAQRDQEVARCVKGDEQLDVG